ncbi:MAG: hypothetical protein LBO08_00395 [Rickettsiales bacterium]|jgi:hypothetical protein|nr:hypothetical protein [Rickettsiales bacterium]
MALGYGTGIAGAAVIFVSAFASKAKSDAMNAEQFNELMEINKRALECFDNAKRIEVK